jgi:DNA repair photolyase
MPAILKACAEAGAQFAGYNMLHLPYAVKDLFDDWLSTHLPEKRNKVLGKIRDVRGGKLNDPNFGTRMTGEGPFADQVRGLFKIACKQARIGSCSPRLSTEHFRNPAQTQMSLFD